MPFMYAATSQQNTNATANTDTLLADLKTASANAGLRAYLQKLQCGSYVTPADNALNPFAAACDRGHLCQWYGPDADTTCSRCASGSLSFFNASDAWHRHVQCRAARSACLQPAWHRAVGRIHRGRSRGH